MGNLTENWDSIRPVLAKHEPAKEMNEKIISAGQARELCNCDEIEAKRKARIERTLQDINEVIVIACKKGLEATSLLVDSDIYDEIDQILKDSGYDISHGGSGISGNRTFDCYPITTIISWSPKITDDDDGKFR